jgi:hypothetical protein
MWFKWRTQRPAAWTGSATESPPTADLPLPADLEQLGEQLSADAARLADRYPPGECRVTPAALAAAARPRRQASWFAAAAAALLLAAGMGGWAGWQAIQSRQAASAPDRVAEGPAGAPPSDHTTAVALPEPNLPETLPAAVFFGDLSPTEQEAVLDVIEQQGHEQAQLSI